MTALERIRNINVKRLEEQGYVPQDSRGGCGQCGLDGLFLLRAFEVMREIALEHCTDLNLHKKYFFGVDELFESRMKDSRPSGL